MVDCLNKMMPLRRDEDVNFAGGLSGEDSTESHLMGKRSFGSKLEAVHLRLLWKKKKIKNRHICLTLQVVPINDF